MRQPRQGATSSGFRSRLSRPQYPAADQQKQPAEPEGRRDRSLPIDDRDRDRPPEREQGPIRVGSIGVTPQDPVFESEDDLDIPAVPTPQALGRSHLTALPEGEGLSVRLRRLT